MPDGQETKPFDAREWIVYQSRSNAESARVSMAIVLPSDAIICLSPPIYLCIFQIRLSYRERGRRTVEGQSRTLR